MRRLVKPFAILMIVLLALPALAAFGDDSPAPSPAPIEAPAPAKAPAQDQIVHVHDKAATGAPVTNVIDHGDGSTRAPTRMALS
jgi:hypothetical protein